MNKKMFAVSAPSEKCDERLRSFAVLLSGDLNVFNTQPTSLSAQYAVNRQMARMRKKFRIESDSDRLHIKAVDDFININKLAGEVVPCLDPRIVADARLFISVALERYTSAITGGRNSSCLDLGMLLRLWRHGPGKSHGVRGTHFVDKVRRNGGTVTGRALRFAQLMRDLDPHCKGNDSVSDFGFSIIRGSRLSTVHKNEDTRRTIATEPLFNMALQLAAGYYVEGALKCVGLDLSTQPDKNKYLAWLGTFCRGLATLDLKNASDLITPALIKLLWPMEFFHFFSAIRSEEIKVEGHGWVPLNMLSTMGNGFTFPVMTMTLLALVYACQSASDKKAMHVDYTHIGVFGDDIIIPKESHELVVETLHAAGLIVNSDKSYVCGLFRESCGGDFWNGKNVTPFYIKSLDNDPEIYIAINQLLIWSIRHRVPCISAMNYLVSCLSVDKPFFVPMWEAPFAGIRVSTSVGRRYKRWKALPKRKMFNPEQVSSFTAMQMIVGNYVTSTDGSSFCYMPRPKRTEYVEDLARLPRGYLDGSDPRIRGTEIDQWLFVRYFA